MQQVPIKCGFAKNNSEANRPDHSNYREITVSVARIPDQRGAVLIIQNCMACSDILEDATRNKGRLEIRLCEGAITDNSLTNKAIRLLASFGKIDPRQVVFRY